MENRGISGEQAMGMLFTTQHRLIAMEIMVRALTKTHPNPEQLVEAVRFFEEAMAHSLGGHLPARAAEFLQSYQDQAGLG